VDLNAPTTGLLSSVVIDLNEEPSVDLNADLMEAQGQLPAAARMDKSDGQEGLERYNLHLQCCLFSCRDCGFQMAVVHL